MLLIAALSAGCAGDEGTHYSLDVNYLIILPEHQDRFLAGFKQRYTPGSQTVIVLATDVRGRLNPKATIALENEPLNRAEHRTIRRCESAKREDETCYVVYRGHWIDAEDMRAVSIAQTGETPEEVLARLQLPSGSLDKDIREDMEARLAETLLSPFLRVGSDHHSAIALEMTKDGGWNPKVRRGGLVSHPGKGVDVVVADAYRDCQSRKREGTCYVVWLDGWIE